MKKTALILVIAMLLQMWLVSCAPKEPSVDESDSFETDPSGSESAEADDVFMGLEDPLLETKKLLYVDWLRYILIMEETYAPLLWSFGYVDRFIEDPTWENLAIARAAVCETEGTLMIVKDFDWSWAFTGADCDILVDAGYDVATVKQTFDTAQSVFTDMLERCTRMKYGLFVDVFRNATYENFKDEYMTLKSVVENYVVYSLYEANYVLAEMKNSTLCERYLTFVAENYPHINSYMPEFIYDTDAILAAGEPVLDSLDEALDKYELLVSLSDLTYEEELKVYESGDVSSLTEDSTVIRGIPFVLPYLYWNDIDGVIYSYYNKDEEDQTVFLDVFDEITEVPQNCMVDYGEVDKAYLIAYANDLFEMGVPYVDIVEDENELSLMYTLGDTLWIFRHLDGKLTLITRGDPLCFAPYWYRAAEE